MHHLLPGALLKPFSLPPDIALQRQLLKDGTAYVFHHRTLGMLGRLMLQEIDGNSCYARSEVAGDPDDPSMEERKRILQPLTENMIAMLPKYRGRNLASPIPPPPPPEKHIVECKHFPCDQCNASVAMVILADDAATLGQFEDYARIMFAQVQKVAIPTWIMGPPKDCDPNGDATFLKVWPTRGPLECLSPEEFKSLIEQLATHHCQKPTSF